MLCISLCAFREAFGEGMVESVYPGQEVEVPDEMVNRLMVDGHIVRSQSLVLQLSEPKPDPFTNSTGPGVPAAKAAPSPKRSSRKRN
jgi:hypothetical protein